MDKLKDSVEAWVKAEFLFKHGPDRYGDGPQAWKLKAEAALCKEVTGHDDLAKAAEALGVDVSDMGAFGIAPKDIPSKTSKESPRAAKPAPTVKPKLSKKGKAQGGLFG